MSTNRSDAHPEYEGAWRAIAILGLQTLHTAIFFFESACVFGVLHAAITNRVNRWTVAAIGVISLEGLILVANRNQCPLRIWTERLGSARGSVTDLFLPRWLADRIFQIYTPLFALGCLGIAVRKWRERKG